MGLDSNGRAYWAGVHKTFLLLITLLVTIALSIGGWTVNQISHLTEVKVDKREIDQMRARLMRIEDKLDRVLYEKRNANNTPTYR